MSVNCQTECELLALVTVVSGELARFFEDTDELMYWGEFVTSLGTNLIMMADQRIRRQNCLAKCKDSKKTKNKDSGDFTTSKSKDSGSLSTNSSTSNSAANNSTVNNSIASNKN